jgi:hypothetical protein
MTIRYVNILVSDSGAYGTTSFILLLTSLDWHGRHGLEVGNHMGWKGKDGSMYTNGIILQIEKEELIKHSLLDDKKEVLSVISYSFVSEGDQTTRHAQEVS